MQHDQTAAGWLRDRFGDAVVAVEPGPIDPWVEVAATGWNEIAHALRDDPATRFDFLNDLCAVDYCVTDKKVAKVIGDPRLVVVYHLSSLARRRTLTVKTTLPRWSDEQAKTPPSMPSVADVWATAEWHECEAYDLSGVEFTGHPNLRRILCPEDWVGHPLRKDYQMPLEYQGIRGR